MLREREENKEREDKIPKERKNSDTSSDQFVLDDVDFSWTIDFGQ